MGTLAEQTEFLTVAEFAARLRVSEPTIHRRVADGALPVVRLTENGAIRILAAAVLEFPACRAADRSSVAAVEPRAHGGGNGEEEEHERSRRFSAASPRDETLGRSGSPTTSERARSRSAW